MSPAGEASDVRAYQIVRVGRRPVLQLYRGSDGHRPVCVCWERVKAHDVRGLAAEMESRGYVPLASLAARVWRGEARS